MIPDHFGETLLGCERLEKVPAAQEIPERYRYPDEGVRLRGPFRILLNRMVDAIDNGQPSPSPNFTDALNSQIVLDAARLSVKKGTWIEL